MSNWQELSRSDSLKVLVQRFENACANYWVNDRDERISDKRLRELHEIMLAKKAELLTAVEAVLSETESPLPMVLHCPNCKAQHIDQPNEATGWTNPPHRSHECQFCGCTWRPADVPTAGVRDIKTKGKKDWPL